MASIRRAKIEPRGCSRWKKLGLSLSLSLSLLLPYFSNFFLYVVLRLGRYTACRGWKSRGQSFQAHFASLYRSSFFFARALDRNSSCAGGVSRTPGEIVFSCSLLSERAAKLRRAWYRRSWRRRRRRRTYRCERWLLRGCWNERSNPEIAYLWNVSDGWALFATYRFWFSKRDMKNNGNFDSLWANKCSWY